MTERSRQTLPTRRPTRIETIEFDGLTYEVCFGFDEGVIREVFITIVDKEDTPISVHCCDAAVLLSILLQYGAPPQEIAHSLLRTGGSPTTPATAPASIIGRVVDRIEEINREIGNDG